MTRLEDFLSDSEYKFNEYLVKNIKKGYVNKNKDIYDYDYDIMMFVKEMEKEKNDFIKTMKFNEKEKNYIKRIFNFENTIYRLCSYINNNKLYDYRKLRFREVLDKFYNEV